MKYVNTKIIVWIKYCLLGFLSLLLILILIAAWLLATQSGLNWLSKRATTLVPELSIERIEGRLLGPLSIQGLNYNNKAIAVHIDTTEFDWQPSELLLSTAIINYLKVSGIDIQQFSDNQKAKAELGKKQEALTLEGIIEQLQLPISILIQEFSVDELAYSQKNDKQKNAKPFILNKFLLSGSSDSQKINIDKLTLNSNIIKLNGDFSLGLASRVNTKGNINWALATEITPNNMAPISGRTKLSGDVKELLINNDIAPPYSTSLKVQINNLLKQPYALVTLAINNVDTKIINNDWPAYKIDSKLRIEGDIDKAELNSEKITITDNNNDKKTIITANTQGQWQNKILNIDIEANAPDLFETIKLTALLNTPLLSSNSDNAITLQLSWKDYNKATNSSKQSLSNSTALLYSPSGEINLQGNLKQYDFDLNALLARTPGNTTTVIEQEQGQLIIDGEGTQENIALNTITLNGPMGSLDGAGDINITPPIAANITLKGKELNPGIISPAWPGQLSLDLLVQTESNKQQTSINTTINSQGTLRGYPFLLDAIASYSDNSIELEKFKLNSGKSTVSASASINSNQYLSAQWAIKSNKLQELVPNIQGKVKSSASINSLPLTFDSNTQLEPKVIVDLDAASIVFANNHLDKLEANIDIDWRAEADKPTNRIDINAQNFESEAATIKLAGLQFKGKPSAHTIATQIDSDKGALTLALEGALINLSSKAQWLFSLNNGSITPIDLSPLTLNKNAKGALSATRQEIEQHCWSTPLATEKDASLCLSGLQENDAINADFSVARFPTHYFTPLFPQGLSWTETEINGEGKINLPQSKPANIAIALTTTPGELNWLNDKTASQTKRKKENTKEVNGPQSIKLGSGQLSVNTDSEKIKATLNLPVEQQKGIKGSFNIANSQQAFIERPLTATLQLELNKLAPFVSFIPDASDLKGKLNSEWKIAGTIQEPKLDGQLALKDSQIRLNSPGILLENISLNLQGDQNKGLSYQATAQSDTGTIDIDGKVQLTKQGPELALSLKGKDFQLLNTAEATVYASPDLTVKSSNNTINIDGSVAIPNATITPKKLPGSVVTSSEDEIIVDENNQIIAANGRQNIFANIELLLSDNVLIEGFGFKGKTTGTLNISKAGQGPTLGNGRIRIVDGEYRAFGQGLVIQKGDILFTDGPIGKPGIDLKALRRPAEGITVGVIARGRAAQPDLSIFSEPAMTQTEQLSWLILGRPPEQSSEGENNAINQLLLSLTLSQGDSYLNSLSETFKLDTLTIKTGSGEAGAASDNELAELVLGKYLSPELYVSYGIGLFKPINVLSLEYSLGRHWTLKSETSSESSGGDLIYTIER